MHWMIGINSHPKNPMHPINPSSDNVPAALWGGTIRGASLPTKWRSHEVPAAQGETKWNPGNDDDLEFLALKGRRTPPNFYNALSGLGELKRNANPGFRSQARFTPRSGRGQTMGYEYSVPLGLKCPSQTSHASQKSRFRPCHWVGR